MKLIDAVKTQKGKPFRVPECDRDSLPQFFKDMGYKVGAEIGVYKGEFTEQLCKVGIKMYAIDPWLPYVGVGRSQREQTVQDSNYEETKERLSPYKDCTVLRKTSMEAVPDFALASLDFVYIDGDHRFRYIAEDMAEWYPKVKPGGVIAGHDYLLYHAADVPGERDLLCQVKPVVDAFVATYFIEDFYIFGETKNDSNLSWMFIKP